MSKNISIPDIKARISFSISVSGKELDYRFGVLTMSVVKAFNKVSYAEITLLDGDVANGSFEASNTDELIIGNEIDIQAGYDGNNSIIFKGIIVKQTVKIEDGASSLIITAKNKACKMASFRHNEVYTDKSDSDIIGEIIKRHGLTPEIDDTSFKHESLTQYNCSDWDFFNMRAEVNSMLVYTEGDNVVVKKPNLNGETKLEINYGSVIFDFEAELNGSNAFSEYKATSWNYISQELESVSQKTGIAETAQGNLSSSDIASSMKNETCEIPVQSTFRDQSELTELVNTIIQKNNLSRITGKVKIHGFSGIHPGDMIDIQRVGDRFKGKTIVSAVEHEISEGSWSSTIQFGIENLVYAKKYDDINGLQASGMLPAINGLQLGKVLQLNDDPLGEGRILVRLSNFASVEHGLWARIATFYAGDERGFFFLPEIDDEVIVGFIDDHPDNAVILGSLNSSSMPSPLNADKDNALKGIYTREKIKLEFNDEKKSMCFETPGGNILTISDDDEGITLEDQNGNKILMKGDGITVESAAALNLKATTDVSIEGTNVSIKSDAAFKAEGQASAEVSASGNTVIKGATVQIN